MVPVQPALAAATPHQLSTREARLIRAADVILAGLVLTASAPALIWLRWLAWRSPFRCRVRHGEAWRYAFGASSRVPERVAALPLWWAVLSGRWSVVGGGAWRDRRPVAAPLRPGLLSLAEVRRVNGLDRDDREALDRELAAGWGVRRYASLLLRGLPTLALSSRSGSRTGEVEVEGLPLQNTSMRSVLALILRAARSGSRWWACFVNADCVNLARRDADYRACLRRCDVVLPDGIGVRLAASLSGQVMSENLVGTDLLPELCRLSSARGVRLFLLGGSPGVAAEAARRLRLSHPGVQIVGTQHGYFARRGAEEDAVLDRVDAATPDVLLVGFGAPLQERWIERVRFRLEVPVLLGVGGLFDYYAGRVPRAPLWMRELGLEWAFRLWQEPRRLWRRYVLGNPSFLLATACDLLARGEPARGAA
jgi:N-acetylglucosaminyldiphosphoundecaprenol N-acetyl-beta-D-mannosaminyltransferase